MAIKNRGRSPRQQSLLKQARTNLISRTARVWSKLGRSLVSDLKGISQPWVERVLKAAMKNIEVGYLEDAPALPARFERELRDALNYAALQGFWLQHVYMKECEAAMEERLYHVPADDPMREALQKLTKYKIELADEWTDIVPQAALEWLKGYTPKLAGKLEEDTLKKVNTVVAKAMEEGLPLKERMEALKAASPQIEKMADTRVEAIVRTEITRADNMGRLTEMTNNPDVIGVEFSAVLDGRTTVMCDHRHGLFMKIDDPRLPYNTPPLHVGCRSVLLSATTFEHPDGLLTSHEFDDGELPEGIQRPEDIEAVREVLGQNAKASDFAFVGNSLPDPEYEKIADLDPLSKNVKKINKYIEAWDRQAAEEVDAIYQTEIGQKIKELIDKGVHKEKEAVALGAMIQEAFHDGIVRHFELVQGVIDRDEFGKGKDKDLAAEIMLRETPNRFLLAALKKYRDIGGVEPVCMESSKDNKAAVELIKRAATYLPSDWVARALVSNGSNIEFHVELLEKGSRANATDTESGNEETNIVRVCAKGLSTAIHELVHIFEARVPAIGDVGMQHLKSRTKGEKPESIAVLLNDSNYSKTELTLKDKFLRIYMGRDYSTERNKAAYSDEHTEVMSMGIPALLFNHYDIWYKAPQPVAKEKKKIGKDGKVTTSFEWVRPELGEVKSSDEHHLRAALGVFFGTKAEAVAQPVRPAKPKKPTLSIRNLIVGKVPEQDEFAEIRGMLVEDIRANRQDAGHGEVNITANILKGFYKSAGIGQIDEDTKTKVGVELSNEEAEARIKALTNYMGKNRSKMWKAYEKDQQGKKLTKEEKGYLNDYKLVAEVVQVMPTFEKADNDPNELYLGIKAGDFASALKDSKEGMILNFGHIMTATSSLKEAEEYAGGKEKTGVILHLKNEFYGDIVDFTSVKGITGKQDVVIGDLYWQVTKTKEDKNTGKFHVYLTSATPGLTSGVGIPQDSSAMSPAPSSFDMASSPAQAKAAELKLSKKIAEQDLAKAEKLRDAFKDAPDFIKNFYERYIDNLQDMKIDELHPMSGSYDNLQIAIAIGRGYYDDEQDFKKVIRHEMGHFFDQMIAHQRDLDAGKDKDDLSIRPVSTKDKDFIAAVTRAEKLCDTSDSGTEAIRAKMRELVHFGEMRSNKAVSDIFSAITHARDKTLYGEGYHSAEYYSKLSHVPNMEIFANLTALYASNDQKGIDFLLKSFPELFNDINNEYLKLMGGTGFKFEAAPAAVAKPKRKKKDAEPSTDATLEVVKPKAKRTKAKDAKITEVVPDVAAVAKEPKSTKSKPSIFDGMSEEESKKAAVNARTLADEAAKAAKDAAKEAKEARKAADKLAKEEATPPLVTLSQVSEEKQKALKGIVLDSIPEDSRSGTIRGVSRELIDKQRGFLSHMGEEEMTEDVIRQRYKMSNVDISIDEAKEIANAIYHFTSGGYTGMWQAYAKHLRGEPMEDYEQFYLKRYMLVKEFTEIMPTFVTPNDQKKVPLEEHEKKYFKSDKVKADPKHRGQFKELYRGVSDDYGLALQQMEIGMIYDLQHVSSTTSSYEQAWGFANGVPGTGVMLHFIKEKDGDILDAPSVAGASLVHHEQEVLMGDRYWTVVDIDAKNPDGLHHIYLKRRETTSGKSHTLLEAERKAENAEMTARMLAAEAKTMADEAKRAEKALKDAEKAAKRAEERAKKEAERAAAKAQRDAERAAKRAEEKAKKDAERAEKKAKKDAERVASKPTRPLRTAKPKTETQTVAENTKTETPHVTKKPDTATSKATVADAGEMKPDKSLEMRIPSESALDVAYNNLRWKRSEEGISGGDMYSIVEKSSELFKKGSTRVGVRVDSANLEAIITSGRLMSQFETKTSGGAVALEYRAKVERELMGYASDTKPEDRPIYGMLFSAKKLEELVLDELGADVIYGDVVIIFKNDIKKYTTVTDGDSLDHFKNFPEEPLVAPSPMLDFKSTSLSAYHLKHLAESAESKDPFTLDIMTAKAHTREYIEAQIHGGQATVDNIEAVIFPRRQIPNSYAYFKAMLDKHGIKWYQPKS